MTQVIKISGREIDQPEFLENLADILANTQEPTVIVHGGGKEISQLQNIFGIRHKYIDGLRVTDEISLELVKMVLCGAVNPRIVEMLQLLGIQAQGISGIDQGMIRARKLEHPEHDYGRVGVVESVREAVLQDLLDRGIMPVVAPICLGADGIYNVNADHVGGAVGAALKADRMVFMTNVPGVSDNQGLVETLTPERAEALITTGIIAAGMIPKVRTAIELLHQGVKSVFIADIHGFRRDEGTIVKLSEE